MTLRIPAEVVDKLAFFEVNVENSVYGDEYDTDETQSDHRTRKDYHVTMNNADLIIKMHIGSFVLTNIPLLYVGNRSNIPEELLRLRHAIVERTEGDTDVILERDDGIITLQYRNDPVDTKEDRLSISLTPPDREAPVSSLSCPDDS